MLSRCRGMRKSLFLNQKSELMGQHRRFVSALCCQFTEMTHGEKMVQLVR